MNGEDPRDRGVLLGPVAVGLIALAWRVALTTRYFGSEEEDYGNLGLILGTLRSGFRYVETEHMPLYTTLSALVMGLTGDAELGGEIVAATAGACAAGLTCAIGWRWIGPPAGLVGGLVVAFQPDFALVSATPLRMSTFVALSLAAVFLFGERRPISGGIALSLAFLTRFDAAFTLLPVMALLALHRRDRRTGAGGGIAAAVVVAWSLYYRAALGTFAFWGSVAERSTGEERAGLATVAQVFGRIVLPHVGTAVVGLAIVGLVLALRRPGADPTARERTWLLALCGGAMTGFFALAVFLSSYGWDHNLFWKWMCPTVPFIGLFAGLVAHRAREQTDALRLGGAAVVAAGILLAGWQWQGELRDQLERSDTWYGTQVRLVRWVEDAYPDDVALVADLIPATWLSRRPNRRVVHLWSQGMVPEGLDEEAFGRWLVAERVALVLTFDEEWVGSARLAPFLQGDRPVTAGPVRLTPIARETGYGFVAWQVSGSPHIPQPTRPPPPDAGAL